MCFPTLTSLPTGEPGLASDLPALLGFPAGLLLLFGACGLLCWTGHSADGYPRILSGSVLGKQAKVLR